MDALNKIKILLRKAGDAEKAKAVARYFKSGKGEYGEGDLFYGITVPEQRKIAKQFYKEISLADASKLLQGKYHEERFTALEILTMQFDGAQKLNDDATQKKIYNLYLASTKYVNNWDLVDTSAEYIVGAFLENKPRTILKKLAKSQSLWERRIAMLSCFHFIKKHDFVDSLTIAKLLLKDKHDLIHKAVGWMLREIGNRDLKTEITFLDAHALAMSRTTLRYATERFPEKLRLKYLHKK